MCQVDRFEWINARTDEPYSQRHVSFVAKAFEKFTSQPRPRFRDVYNEIANVKAAHVAQETSKVVDGEMDAAAQRTVWQLVQATAPTDAAGKPVVNAAHVKSLTTVVKTLIDSDAIDNGTGEMVPLHSLPPEKLQAVLRANLTEETYERAQRQAAHIQRAVEPSWAVVVVCTDAVDQEAVARRLEAEGRTVRRISPKKAR